MESFETLGNRFYQLNIVGKLSILDGIDKLSILDICRGPGYNSAND